MKYVSADEAVKLVRSGDTVVCQGGTSVPVILQEALARRHEELRGVQIVSGFNITAAEAPFCKPEYKDSFLVNSIFISADQRKHIAAGYGTMTPAFLGEVPGLFRRREMPVDVAFINCSLPDENGYLSFGISADIAVSAVECARVVIAQVSPNIPYLYGKCLIHESEIAAAVYTEEPPLGMVFGDPTPIEAAIGANVASQIPDGACLQIGVGGQHDFMYGCSLAEEGRIFIALPSRTTKGKSKIVPTLTPGAGVVTTRFQTQYVATEHGIVYLRGKSLAERAKLLISIAHPDDREELEKAACKRFGYSFLRLR